MTIVRLRLIEGRKHIPSSFVVGPSSDIKENTMIPKEFNYVAPATLSDALAALRDGGEDAKVLAGGHSLIPMMKLRLASPTLLVDLRKVPGLAGIQADN